MSGCKSDPKLRATRRATPVFRVVARLSLIAALGLSGCVDSSEFDAAFAGLPFASAKTEVRYEPVIEGAPSDEVKALLEASLTLFRRQEDGAPSVALLRRRAEQDVETARKVLRSQGYYSAEIASEVAAAEPDAEAKPAPKKEFETSADSEPAATAVATIRITPGPQYTIERHAFVSDDPDAELSRETLSQIEAEAARPGAPARAVDILAAEADAVAALRRLGRHWARSVGRRAVANPERATLTVETRLSVGPVARFGPLEIIGAEAVEQDHIASYMTWEPGEVVRPRALAGYQRALADANLFSAVSVSLPESPPPGSGAEVIVPATVRVEERAPRSFSAGVRYDTDTGPKARLELEHRNLFGSGEQAMLLLEGGAVEQQAELSGRIPQFLRPAQDLTGAVGFRHLEDEAYDETAIAARLGIERRLDSQWTVGLGGLVEYARLIDEDDQQDVILLGAPGFARLDASDDLLNPTEGYRLAFQGTPFIGETDGRSAPFLTLDGAVSGYLPLDEARRHVLAGRARLGVILADQLADVPSNRRLYSGGGGSVRGYRERFIGPLDDNGDPVGGRQAAEAGIELRSRIYGDFGAVAFLEGGAVSRDLGARFESGLQSAAGVGLRYYSPVGPIRADIATPLDPRREDDPFQLYFSIGQAF